MTPKTRKIYWTKSTDLVSELSRIANLLSYLLSKSDYLDKHYDLRYV